jgi:hypothetical protein
MKNWEQRLFVTVMTIFMLVCCIMEINAEERKGKITGVNIIQLAGTVQERLELRVDTSGNRIADSQLHYPDPYFSGFSKNLLEFVERGMEIVFDDEGYIVLPGGNIQVNGDNTISIDGVSVIELFPNEKERFKHAIRAYARQRSE